MADDLPYNEDYYSNEHHLNSDNNHKSKTKLFFLKLLGKFLNIFK